MRENDPTPSSGFSVEGSRCVWKLATLIGRNTVCRGILRVIIAQLQLHDTL